DRLIRHLLDRLRHHTSIRERLRLGEPAFENEAAHLGQGRLRIGIDGVVRAAREERIFVELKALERDAAEHHRADAPVADRQRLHPFIRRLSIPERKRLGRKGIARSCVQQRAVRCERQRARARDQLAAIDVDRIGHRSPRLVLLETRVYSARDHMRRAPSLLSGNGVRLSATIRRVLGSMRRKRCVRSDINTSSPVGVSIHWKVVASPLGAATISASPFSATAKYPCSDLNAARPSVMSMTSKMAGSPAAIPRGFAASPYCLLIAASRIRSPYGIGRINPRG